MCGDCRRAPTLRRYWLRKKRTPGHARARPDSRVRAACGTADLIEFARPVVEPGDPSISPGDLAGPSDGHRRSRADHPLKVAASRPTVRVPGKPNRYRFGEGGNSSTRQPVLWPAGVSLVFLASSEPLSTLTYGAGCG